MISACCFIRNTFTGAFCIFESMASLLPFVDEMLIMDLGSDDGTLQDLDLIADRNPKVNVITGEFPETDAAAFATLANDLVEMCTHNNVIYWQADEIWHQDLLRLMGQRLEAGHFDLSFWRIQYKHNFQKIGWFPHIVHRVGQKGRFNFVEDGMTTDRSLDAELCSQYDGGYFPRWGDMGPEAIKGYVNEMIMDVSLLGGFRDNIVERRTLHAPFWHEDVIIEHKPADQWYNDALINPDWTKTTSPYNLPQIMRYHVGKTRYELRVELLEALQRDDTAGMVGL